MAWLWSILALVGNFTGFSLLKRTPKLKQSFGGKEHDWLVNAVWDMFQQFVPFMLICNLLLGPQNKARIKNSLLLNAFMTFICLAIPAVIEHLSEYPEFQMNIKDVEQHNSIKRIQLFAAFSFASSSFGLSKVYGLPFESGFFYLCLGYAMAVSLEVVDKNGNRFTAFIVLTYVFCFLVILLRKYLEKNIGNDTTMQRDYQSSDNTNTADQNPNSNDEADQSPSTSSNANDLQGGHIELTGRLALHQHNQRPMIDEDRTLDRDSSIMDIESGQSNTREESWDINEQNWEAVPPRLYNDISVSNSGEEDNDDIITCSEISNYFAEGSSSIDDHLGKIKEREVSDHEIGPGKQDMGPSTSSCHMKITGSTEFGAYEKAYVSPLLTKSDNIINGKTQIVKDHMERSKDQSEEIDSDQDYQIDNNPLLRKSSLKGDDDDSDSNHESSDGDDLHSGTGSKIGAGHKHKDPCQESDFQNQGNKGHLSESMNVEVDHGQIEGSGHTQDETNYEGIRELFYYEETNKPFDDLKYDSFDDEGNDGDDFNSKAGCKFGRREMNKCPVKKDRDITNLDESRACKPKEKKKQLPAVKFKMNLEADQSSDDWNPTAAGNLLDLEDMEIATEEEHIDLLLRRHQQGRCQARIGRVSGNKDLLYLETFGRVLM